MRTALRISWLIAMSFAAALSSAQNSTPLNFNLPDHGKLLLAVPRAWNADVHPRQGRSAPTLELQQKNAAPFRLLLTPMWTADSDTPLPNDAAVRDKVAAAAKEAQAQSAEPTLAVNELFGKANRGYYFTATDRAPKPDEWKYLTQGIVRIGPIDLAFSVLTNDGQEAVIKDALAMLLTASHSD
jgi:hypothetical protein